MIAAQNIENAPPIPAIVSFFSPYSNSTSPIDTRSVSLLLSYCSPTMQKAQGIYLLDIPMIVDAICEYLSLQDILHCRQVGTAWFNYFNPYCWKTTKFVDLSEKHTIEILQNTARIRSLTVDLQDPDLLVTNSYARQCTQLKELHCANFEYLEQGDAWYGPHDPRKNALFLLESNPKLERLEIDRPVYAVFLYFVPRIIASLSQHSCLTTLRISGFYTDTVMDVLCHLPLSIQDVEMHLIRTWSTSINHPPDLNPSPASIITPTTFEDRFKQGRLYQQLTRLDLEIMSASEVSFLPLLKLCPAVQDLYMSESLVEGSIQLLTTVLEHCPRLQSCGNFYLLWETSLGQEDDIELFKSLRRTFLSRIHRLNLAIGHTYDEGHNALSELIDAAGKAGQQTSSPLADKDSTYSSTSTHIQQQQQHQPSHPLEVLNLVHDEDLWWGPLHLGSRVLATFPHLRELSSSGHGISYTHPLQQHPEAVDIGVYFQNTRPQDHRNDPSPKGRSQSASTRWSRRRTDNSLSTTNISPRIHSYTLEWEARPDYDYFKGEVSLQDLVDDAAPWASHNLQLLHLKIIDSDLLNWEPYLEPKHVQITRVSALVYKLFRRLRTHAARDLHTGSLTLKLTLTWSCFSFQLPLETALQAMWAQGLFDANDDEKEPLRMTEADAVWMCLPWPTLAEVGQLTHQQQLTHTAHISQREPPRPNQSLSSILSYSDQGWFAPRSDYSRCYHHDDYIDFAEKVPEKPRLQRQLEELEDRPWCTNTKKYRHFGTMHHRKRLSSWIEYER